MPSYSCFVGENTSAKNKNAFSMLIIDCLLHWATEGVTETAGKLCFSQMYSRFHANVNDVRLVQIDENESMSD